MGVSYTQLYSQFARGNYSAIGQASYTAILTQLRNMGVNLNLTGAALDNELYNKAFILTTLLQELLPVKPDGTPYNWQPNTAVEFVKQIIKGNGNPAAALNQNANTSAASVQSTLNNMTGGKTGAAGATNFFNSLGNDIGLDGPRNQNFSINYDGKTTSYYGVASIERLPLAQQQALMEELASGSATITKWANGANPSKTATLGQFLNNAQLINAENPKSNQVTITLDPKASKYFNVEGQKNLTINYNSSTGTGSNTNQTTGWSQ
jgi:hypothetical protein